MIDVQIRINVGGGALQMRLRGRKLPIDDYPRFEIQCVGAVCGGEYVMESTWVNISNYHTGLTALVT